MMLSVLLGVWLLILPRLGSELHKCACLRLAPEVDWQYLSECARH